LGWVEEKASKRSNSASIAEEGFDQGKRTFSLKEERSYQRKGVKFLGKRGYLWRGVKEKKSGSMTYREGRSTIILFK